MSYPWLCSDCSWLNPNESNRWGDKWCTAKRRWVEPDSTSCSNDFSNKRGYSYSTGMGCFITTAMCEILGQPDDCFTLETFREFRNKYMLYDKVGLEVLEDYKTLGPQVAESLRNDPNKLEVAQGMYYNHIIPIISKIQNKEYDSVIEAYENMGFELMDRYGIEYEGKLGTKTKEDRGNARKRVFKINNQNKNDMI